MIFFISFSQLDGTISPDFCQCFTHTNTTCRHILNMEAFSSTLLDEICRFVNELLVQEVWNVSAIRNQQDVILQKNIDYNTEQK